MNKVHDFVDVNLFGQRAQQAPDDILPEQFTCGMKARACATAALSVTQSLSTANPRVTLDGSSPSRFTCLTAYSRACVSDTMST